MIDHEGALAPLLKIQEHSLHSLELDRFYDHVFYAAVSRGDAAYTTFLEALDRLSPSRIEKLVGQVPSSWQAAEDLAKVQQHLQWIVENREQVCGLIRERLS